MTRTNEMNLLPWMERWGMLPPAGGTVLVAVSGGRDSVCLLHYLARLGTARGFSVAAAHLDHGQRPTAARDVAFVQSLCRTLDVPCHVGRADVPALARELGVGVEEAGRRARYEFLERTADEIGAARIATAHHAGDQAETVLLHLLRGAGTRGLRGIPPVRGRIVRPLLQTTRAEIEAYLEAQGQPYCRDATNEDTDYSRNRIRHKVMPELKAVNTGAVHHMMQSAQMLRELSDYLEEETRRAAERVCSDNPDACVIDAVLFSEYPVLLIREVLLGALQKVAGSSRDIGSVHVEELCTLYTRQVGRVICLPYGVRAERVYEGIRLYREAPAADMERESIEITGEMLSRAEKEEVVLALPDGRLHLRIRDFSGNMQEIPKKTYTKWFDYGKIKSGLRLRRRESGDYLKIDAAGHTKKLKEYFVNEKIPAAKRDAIWLLATGSEILWVAGGRIGAGCKVGENTEKILEVRLSGGNDCEDQEN